MIKQLTKEKSYFVSIKNDKMIYMTESGFEYDVPVSETKRKTFTYEMLGSSMVRYIRKQLQKEG